jgi:hypothetical protein
LRCFNNQSHALPSGHGKLAVLAGKVLVFWDLAANEGIAYSFGDMRDLLTGADEAQVRVLLGKMPTANNTFMSARGAASYKGGSLTIHTQRFRHTAIEQILRGLTFKAGDIVGVSEEVLSFEIAPPCNRCKITEMQAEQKLAGHTVGITTLRRSSCDIN